MKSYRQVSDALNIFIHKVVHGTYCYDDDLLQLYRLAYIFANGILVVPHIYFENGEYCFLGMSLDKNGLRTVERRNPHSLRRMAKRLIKRRFEEGVEIIINDEIIGLIRSTLTTDEVDVLEGRKVAPNVYPPDHCEYIDFSLSNYEIYKGIPLETK